MALRVGTAGSASATPSEFTASRSECCLRGLFLWLLNEVQARPLKIRTLAFTCSCSDYQSKDPAV